MKVKVIYTGEGVSNPNIPLEKGEVYTLIGVYPLDGKDYAILQELLPLHRKFGGVDADSIRVAFGEDLDSIEFVKKTEQTVSNSVNKVHLELISTFESEIFNLN